MAAARSMDIEDSPGLLPSGFSPSGSQNYMRKLDNLCNDALLGTLAAIRSLGASDAVLFSRAVIPECLFPSQQFLRSLSAIDHVVCHRLCLLLFTVTRGKKVPRQFQLEAALETVNSRDSIVIAGTGSGKTICIALPILLDPKCISITVSPLKRLQILQVREFNSLQIRTLAINEDTTNDPQVWKDVNEGKYPHLIVQPEQFFAFKGHLPRLANLLQGHSFRERVKRLFVDEAHNIATSGLPRDGQEAFRPAWAKLNEVRLRLPKAISVQALSATIPNHILDIVDKHLLLSPEHRIISLSINRPNIMYANHLLVGGINNYKNLDCIIPADLHPPIRLPKLLIVHDDKAEASRVATYLNNRLPPALQCLDIVKHYHSDMSQQYLDTVFDDFSDPDGKTLILCATSGAGTGLDVPFIDGVIQYGVCASVPETFQRGGRAGRGDPNNDAFFLTMFEPWVLKTDPKRVNAPTTGSTKALVKKKRSTKEERTDVAAIRLCQEYGYPDRESCIRNFFALYFGDESSTNLHFTTRWCCPGHIGNGFSLDSLFLGPTYTGLTVPLAEPARKRKRNKYRPKEQRRLLQEALEDWRMETYYKSPNRIFFRLTSILTDSDILDIAKLRPEVVNSSTDIAMVLNRSCEWEMLYGSGIVEMVKKFDSSCQMKDEVSSDEEPLAKRIQI